MQIIEYATEFRVHIDFNHFKKRNEAAVKKIPGVKWDWSDKVWKFPLSSRMALVRLQKYTKAKYYKLDTESPEEFGEIKPLPELDQDVPLSHPDGFGFRPYQEKGASDSEIAKKMRGEIIVKMAELKKISAYGKLNEAKEFIKEVTDSGEKLIVFVVHHVIVDELLKEFPNAVTVTGRDKDFEKQRSIDAFQNDPGTKLIICNIKAAGVGITLTASSRVAFIEYPWTYADCVQCEDRAHRIGQTNNVMCTYFLGQNTIDERMYELILEKRHVANTITGATDSIKMDMVSGIMELFK